MNAEIAYVNKYWILTNSEENKHKVLTWICYSQYSIISLIWFYCFIDKLYNEKILGRKKIETYFDKMNNILYT